MKTHLPKKSEAILPVLSRFKDELLRIYPDQLLGIILFGSYARGDFNEGSDIDLMLLFDDSFKEFKKDDEIFDLITNCMLEEKLVISPLSAKKSFFDTKKTPLNMNVKNEGITLWKK